MYHWGGWGEEDKTAAKKPPLTLVAGYSRVLGYILPHWRESLLALGAILTVSLLGLLPPLILKEIIDSALPQERGGYLNLLVIATVALPLVSSLIGVGQSYLNNQVGQRIMLDLRTQLYSHLQRMEIGFFTQARSGEIVSRLTNDVAGVEWVVSGTFANILTNILTVVPSLIVMFILSWQLTLLSLVLLPLFIYPTRRVGRIRRGLRKETQERLADLSSQIDETLGVSGAMLVRTFGQEAAESERFRQRSQRLMEANIKQAVTGRWFYLVMGIFSAAAPALVYWYGGHKVIGGTMTIGAIMAFVAYQGRLFGPVNALMSIHVDLTSSLALFERIFEYLDMKPAVADKPDAKVLPRVAGHVAFRNVGFSYIPERAVLQDITFDIQPGQLAALVGPTGAGKSTISYMVARLYDPATGRVEIDGHGLRDVTMASLRSQIGVVSQDVFLLNDTLLNNLKYARPDASEREVAAAVEAARLTELVAGLPEGYQTLVGERGHRLSGGQKQQVAIARALLRDPRILVLDEATSNLDVHNERLIREALAELMRGRTSLVIAHRLSTVVSADVILVISEGRLVEQGRHSELLARGGIYAGLYREGAIGTVVD